MASKNKVNNEQGTYKYKQGINKVISNEMNNDKSPDN